MTDAKQIVQRADKAREERAPLQPVFDDAMRLTMPARKRFHDSGQIDGTDDIFDETGANAVQEFVSRMQAGLFPPFTKFVRLEPSSLVPPRDRDAVQRDLDEIVDYAFEQIWASNFAQESAESLNDLAISTGTLLVEEGDDDMPLLHRAIPLTELFLERGPNDMIGAVFREAKVPAEKIPLRYKRAQVPEGSALDRAIKNEHDRPLTCIEATFRDHGAPGVVHRHVVVVKEFEEMILDRRMEGVGSSPFLVYRWATAAGETWGRGPLLNALAAIRTTNLMVEMVLENAAMSIVGMYQTDNDGVVNADNISLLPGTIIQKEIGTAGLEQIKGNTGNFNMQDVVLSDQRLNIKRALYNDMLSDPNKTPATATEVAERMADLAHRTSSGFARVFYEFVVPYIQRVLYILEKRGDIEMPVKGGRAISYHAVSPLAQAQQSRELQRLVGDYQVRATLYGPQAAALSYDFERVHTWLQEKQGLPGYLYKDGEQFMRELREQAESVMEAQQAMQGQPMTGGGQ